MSVDHDKTRDGWDIIRVKAWPSDPGDRMSTATIISGSRHAAIVKKFYASDQLGITEDTVVLEDTEVAALVDLMAGGAS